MGDTVVMEETGPVMPVRETDSAVSTSGDGHARTDSGTWRRVKKKWQKEHQHCQHSDLVDKLLTMTIAMSLVVVVTALLLIVVVILSVLYVNYSTQLHATTKPSTSTQTLSLEEQYMQQEFRCQVINAAVDVTDQVKELLPENDDIGDSLLPVTIMAKRCRGLCDSDGYCLARSTVVRDIVVRYRGENGAIMYTKRKMQDHTDCMCEAP